MNLPACTIAQECLFSHYFDKNGKIVISLKLFNPEHEEYASLDYYSSKKEIKSCINPKYADLAQTICDIGFSLCIAYEIGSENTLMENAPDEVFYKA